MRPHNIPVILDLVKEVIIDLVDLVVFQWWLWRTVKPNFYMYWLIVTKVLENPGKPWNLINILDF